MLPLSHYNVFGQKVVGESTGAEVWNDLSSNLFVVAEVLSVTRDRVHVKLEKGLGTTKTHLHNLLPHNIYVSAQANPLPPLFLFL